MIYTTELPGSSPNSLLRTYRNLRIGIGSVVIVVMVSVGVAAQSVGVLSSISAYYYTPARTMFVGALMAASLGLLTISGRGFQRVLLDTAGLLAPLIAILPTPIGNNTVPGLDAGCPPGRLCVPQAFHADVANGIYTFVIVGTVVVVVILILSRTKSVDLRSVAGSLVAAAAVLAAVIWLWQREPELLLNLGHVVAAAGFFLMISAAAVVVVFPGVDRSKSKEPGKVPSKSFRTMYLIIAAGFVIDIAIVASVIVNGNVDSFTIPVILVCELVALGLFLLFWILQSFPKWTDPNPGII